MGKGLGKEVVVGKRTVDGKKDEIVVTYVPRTVLVESDGGYESVRLEKRLERALEEHGLSLLFGLSGVGKSTSAEYVSKVFAERGWVVIKLIPIGEGRKDDEKRDFKIDVVRYGDKAVFHVYISTSYLGSEERMMKLAYAISKLSKKVVKDEKALMNFLGKILKIVAKAKAEVKEEMREPKVGFLRDLFKKAGEIGEVVKNLIGDLLKVFPLDRSIVTDDQAGVFLEAFNELTLSLGISLKDSVEDVMKALKREFPIVSMAIILYSS